MKSISLKVLAAITLALGTASAAVSQVVSIGSESVSNGGVATVDLVVSGLGNGTALGAFDVNVGFDPGVVSFSSASYGDPVLGDQLNLEGFGTFSATTPGTGTVDLFELSFDSSDALLASQPSAFTLATLTFDAVANGVSPLLLSVNAISDQTGINPITPTLRNGSIGVTSAAVAAPEIDPASAVTGITLLMGGILVLRGRRPQRAPQVVGY